MKRLGVVAALGLVLAASLPAPRTHAGRQYSLYSRVTFFRATGDVMRSGLYPFPGAAACGDAIPMYAHVDISTDWGAVSVECLDTGWLAPTQVDVYSEVWPWWLTRDYFAVEVW